MTEVVTIDKKGRLLLPKKVRDSAKVEVPGKMVVLVKEEGHIELLKVDSDMKIAKEIAKRKLANWKERDHEATKLAYRLTSVKND